MIYKNKKKIEANTAIKIMGIELKLWHICKKSWQVGGWFKNTSNLDNSLFKSKMLAYSKW